MCYFPSQFSSLLASLPSSSKGHNVRGYPNSYAFTHDLDRRDLIWDTVMPPPAPHPFQRDPFDTLTEDIPAFAKGLPQDKISPP